MILFGIAYSLCCVDKKKYRTECLKLIRWGKVLYWLLLLSSFLHFSSSIIKLIFTYFIINSEIPNYIMMLKSCLKCITSIIILIGITIAYFKFKDHYIVILYQKLFLLISFLNFLFFAYLLFVFILFIFLLFFCNKNNNKYLDEDIDDYYSSDEEMDI